MSPSALSNSQPNSNSVPSGTRKNCETSAASLASVGAAIAAAETLSPNLMLTAVGLGAIGALSLAFSSNGHSHRRTRTEAHEPFVERRVACR